MSRTTKRIPVLGTSFDNITMEEAVSAGTQLLKGESCCYAVTPNPEIVMNCRVDPETACAVSEAALVIPDGIGIIYGARILGTPLKEKVPGIDFVCGLLGAMALEGQSVYLLGSKPGVAEKAGETLLKKFPGLRLAGCHDGYFQDDGPVIEAIEAAHPDLLLVCLGAPKQEKWMHKNRDKLSVPLMIGAGGSLDVFAGTAQRAPASFQKLGLEWFYRLLKEPWRLGRMMKLPQFLLLVIGERVTGKAGKGA